MGRLLARLNILALLAVGSCDTGQTCPECPECPPAPECPACPPPTAGNAVTPMPDKGDIKLTFRESKRATSKAWADKMKKAEVFERLIDAVNDTIALPRDAAVLVADCGRIDAYYDLKAPGIVICYELLDHFDTLFKARIKDPAVRESTVIGAVFFAFLHELGHALVDQLELPVTGKEEDAVDQLAAVILISSGSSGVQRALNGARAFLLHSKKGFSGTEFWDEHSFEEQRYYSILCLAYGAQPKKLQNVVGKKGGLPVERAKTCSAEFVRIRKAWQTLLAPHGKA